MPACPSPPPRTAAPRVRHPAPTTLARHLPAAGPKRVRGHVQRQAKLRTPHVTSATPSLHMYSSQGWKVVLVHQEALHSPSHRTHVQQTDLHKTESGHILIGMKTGTTTNIEIVSHRGAAFEAPENTIPGFEHALRLGMTTVEFDVHITADDQLVVIHDATVDRTTNGTGAVNQMTLSELQALDARAIHTDWPEPCRIPTFEETLRALAGMPNMEVEIKSDTPENMRRVVE